MIPEMIATNKSKSKMFLAVALFAALAAVSVAGVVLQEDSYADAPATSITSQEYVINGDANVNIYIKKADTALVDLELKVVGKSTGTVNVGYYADEAAKTGYTVVATLVLTDASNVSIRVAGQYYVATGEYLGAFTLNNVDTDGTVLPSGSYELKLGAALIGDHNGFNGALKAGDFTVATEWVKDVVVIYDGTKASFGARATFVEPVALNSTLKAEDKIVQGKVSLSGTASVGSTSTWVSIIAGGNNEFNTAADVKLVVESGADITVGDIEPTVGEAIVKLDAGVTTVYAALFDGGKLIASSGTTGGIVVTSPSNDVVISDLTLNKEYKLLILADNEIYYGNFSTNGSGASYTMSLRDNEVNKTASADLPIDVLAYDSANQLYGLASAAYSLKFAYNLDTEDVYADRQMAFPSGANVLVLFSQSSTTFAFSAQVQGAPLKAVDQALTGILTKQTGTVAPHNIKEGDVTANEMKVSVKLEGPSDVYGKMTVLYNSPTIKGEIVAEASKPIVVLENGYISYTVNKGFTGSSHPLAGGVICAAYYKTLGNTTDTFHYKTLTNAINNTDSKVIYITGTVVITEDTTIPANITDVIITNGSSLVVGDKDHNPILTVPDTANVTKEGSGSFIVENGQAVFDKIKADESNFFAPVADVKVVKGDKVIYTDVATALGLVESGNTIDLLRNAWLNKDAVIPAGVTLNDNGKALTVPSGVTLTVNGTLKSTGSATGTGPAPDLKPMGIIGNVIINNGGVVTYDGANYDFSGSITVNAGGTLTIGGTAAANIDGAVDGVITNKGTVTVKGNSTVSVKEVNLLEQGKLVIEGGSTTFTISKSFVIGAEPVLLTDLKNDTKVSGKVTLGTGALVLAYGASEFTDANIANGFTKTVFVIGNTANAEKVYATQYSSATGQADLENLRATKLKDYSLVGWYTSDALDEGSRFNFNVTPAPVVGAKGTLYGNFTPKMYNVALYYNAGINWIVDGMNEGGSKTIQVAYGSSIRVSVEVLPGYTGTPVITVNDTGYTAGTAYIVTDNVNFAVKSNSVSPVVDSGNDSGNDKEKLGLIEILLIIIVIIIGIIMIIVAIKLLRS